MNEKFDKLMNDEEFLRKLLTKQTIEGAKQLFHENGVDLSDDDMKALSFVLYDIINKSGEVSESVLENVSGGKGLEYNEKSKFNSVLNRFCSVVPEISGGHPTGKSHWYPSAIKIGETALKVAGVATSILSLKKTYNDSNAGNCEKLGGWITLGASTLSLALPF